VRYFEWIQDILPASKLISVDAYTFSINYISEIKAGDSITLYTSENGDTVSIEGRKNDDNNPQSSSEDTHQSNTPERGGVSFRAEFIFH
jgi:hypothetical protein